MTFLMLMALLIGKPQKKTTPSMEVDYDVVVTANDGVDVTYQAHTISGKWLESVKNTDDFA